MINTPYQQGFYPVNYMPQAQMQNNLEQKLQSLQNQLNNSQQNSNTNRLFVTSSIQEAQNAQIPMDGTTTYFVSGDTVLAKNWSFATGKIENVYFKKVEEVENKNKEPDRLELIETKIDKIMDLINPPTIEETQEKDNFFKGRTSLGGKKNDK